MTSSTQTYRKSQYKHIGIGACTTHITANVFPNYAVRILYHHWQLLFFLSQTILCYLLYCIKNYDEFSLLNDDTKLPLLLGFQPFC